MIYYVAFALVLTTPPVLAVLILANAFFVSDGGQPFDELLFQQELSLAAQKARSSEVSAGQLDLAVEAGEPMASAA